MAGGAGFQLTLRTVVLITSTATSRGAAVGTEEHIEEGQENGHIANNKTPLQRLLNTTTTQKMNWEKCLHVQQVKQ